MRHSEARVDLDRSHDGLSNGGLNFENGANGKELGRSEVRTSTQEAHHEPPQSGRIPKCHPLTFRQRKVHFWRALKELNNISKVGVFFFARHFSTIFGTSDPILGSLDPHPITIMHTPSDPPVAAPG